MGGRHCVFVKSRGIIQNKESTLIDANLKYHLSRGGSQEEKQMVTIESNCITLLLNNLNKEDSVKKS